MRRRSFGSLLAYAAVAGMAAMLLWQILHLGNSKEPREDPVLMLYQVSQFQMESLGSILQESSGWSRANELGLLRQAAYSADYTHSRLILSVGEGELPKLTFYDALLQYILRIQVGGERPLKQEEKDTLKKLSEQYQNLLENYEGILNATHDIIQSKKNAVQQADETMTELIKKHLN